MIHLGDITKISGYDAPIVDCVIGGSPCQDLSVAGRRAGLAGERSGLFMEQLRIVKEMRERDEQRNGRTDDAIRPRYMVWENVPGAFSSNKGEDFRIVLEEIAKVSDKDAVIPMPPKGKWTTCGNIVGDGWSIAWRVLDARFWGVPQRRRRIALVADFGGQSASEILFVRKGVSRDIDESKPKRKEASSDATGGIRADDCLTFEPGIASREGGHVYENVSGTLRANAGDNQMSTAYGISSYSSNAMMSSNPHSGIYEADTSRTLDANCGNPACNQGGIAIVESVPYTLKIRGGVSVDSSGKAAGKGALIQENLSATLGVSQDQYLFQPVVSIDQGGGKVVYALDRASYNQGKNAQFDFEVSDKGVNSPLVAKGPSAVCYKKTYQQTTGPLMANSHPGAYSGQDAYQDMFVVGETTAPQALNGNNVVRTRYIVRRLTPMECERLQGYPDGWTDIGEWVDTNGKKKQTSDAARYKALGNSIALPPWKWVLKRLCACYERDATMASLFDGIGGFPYLWEQINGKGSCLWASEVEEFPIAVTKVRIGGK